MPAFDLLARPSRPLRPAVGSRSVYGILRTQADQAPAAPALLGVDRGPLTYLRLQQLVEQLARDLASWGLGRGDRVALALPNGPETAVLFLAVASVATCAPLNPNCRESEFDYFLSDLRAKAIVLPAQSDSAARMVAASRGIAVLEVEPLGPEAGALALHGGPDRGPATASFASEDDVALVLHTSGTTARPKLVPLRHDALCAAAETIRASLDLTAADRCLNVMPTFHLHALSVLLASLSAGAAVACAPPFTADGFFDWLDAFTPTWYSASPTLHQAILERAPARADVVARQQVRLIRSTSAPLPPTTLTGLERLFSAPVIEAYAVTEAPSQITSNPLPPLRRKVGSAGVVNGPEVAIVAPNGAPLPTGQAGEVRIRGPYVVPAYEDNPEANASAFVEGWFRTGDLGYFDDEGYLFLTGRAKEVINKGGEKISPREVEEATLSHPAVAEVVAFAIPHPRLGEDVALAVVLRAESAAKESDLRAHVATRLADFKVPRLILLVPEIPKGPTGKLQRARMAELLRLTGEARQVGTGVAVSPRTPTEQALAKLWAQALGVERVGLRDDFFLAGGDSLLAANLVAQIERQFGKRLPMTVFLQQATVEHVAAALSATEPPRWTSLVPMQPEGNRPPLFLVPGIGGELVSFAAMTRRWEPSQPLYGLRVRAIDGVTRPFDRIEDMAGHYVSEVRQVQPEGPYHLCGYSFGAMVAYEMAQQLRHQGHEVALLAVVDGDADVVTGRKGGWGPRAVGRFLANVPWWVLEDVVRMGPRTMLRGLRPKMKSVVRRAARLLSGRTETQGLESQGVFDVSRLAAGVRVVLETHLRARQNYVPQRYAGTVTLVRARARPLLRGHEPDLGWGQLADDVDIRVVPGNHATVLQEPNVRRLAEVLSDLMR